MENQSLEAFIKKEKLMKKIRSLRLDKIVKRAAINTDLKKLDEALSKLIETDAGESQNLFSEYEDLDNYLAEELK